MDPRYNATSHGTLLLEELLGRKVEGCYPKSINVVLDTLKLTTNPGDIILDFFAGTGTTAHAILRLNEIENGGRQYILIEQLERQVNVCKERLEKVFTETRITHNDFIYCELMQYNQTYMDKIQAAQSSEELIALWQDIAENSFLNWYVNAETPEEAVDDFIAIDDLEAQKHLLVELLDKNQLYVNLSEIEDADFGVCGEDRELNREFYKK